jgi:hypothetical protein
LFLCGIECASLYDIFKSVAENSHTFADSLIFTVNGVVATVNVNIPTAIPPGPRLVNGKEVEQSLFSRVALSARLANNVTTFAAVFVRVIKNIHGI